MTRAATAILWLLMFTTGSAETLQGPGTVTNTNHFVFYTFEPKDDITTHELSLIVKVLVNALGCQTCNPIRWIEELPPEARRHFVKHG